MKVWKIIIEHFSSKHKMSLEHSKLLFEVILKYWVIPYDPILSILRITTCVRLLMGATTKWIYGSICIKFDRQIKLDIQVGFMIIFENIWDLKAGPNI